MQLSLPMPAPRRETFDQLVVEHTRRQIHRALARNDQEIYPLRQCRAVAPEKFPYLPFDPITYHRVADLAANRDTQAGLGTIVGPADDDKIFGMDLIAGPR